LASQGLPPFLAVEPIRGGQLRLLDRTTQDAELVPKGQVLQLEGGSGLDGC